MALLQDVLDIAEKQMWGSQGAAARSWLHERAVVDSEIKKQQLGFYLNFHVVEHELKARGHSPETIREVFPVSGPKFDGRIVGAFNDENGTLRSLWGRIIKQDQRAHHKYVFLKGVEKPQFYGLDVARQHGSVNQLIIVEGMFDVFGCNSVGYYNVVALAGLGALLTPERWRSLGRHGVRGVVLVLDSDAAGIDGLAAALANHAQAFGAPAVYVVPPNRLGSAKDPDKYIRDHGAEAFVGLVSEAVPGAIYRCEQVLDGIDVTSREADRRAALERILDLSMSLSGPMAALDRDALLQLAADRTGYSIEALGEALVDHERHQRIERVIERLGEGSDSLRAVADDEALAETVRRLATDLEAHAVAAPDEPPPFIVDDVLDEIRQQPEGLSTGLKALDDLDVRFGPGELAIIGARTSHAKTTTLVAFISNWMKVKMSLPPTVILYSLEEPVPHVLARLLAALTARIGTERTGWSVRDILDYLRDPKSRPTWPDPNLLDAAIDRLRQIQDHLLVVHRPSWTVEQIVAHAHCVAEQQEIMAILVDYLQRIPPSPIKADRRDIEISHSGRMLKTLAIDLDVPVIAAAQINREAIPPRLREQLKGKAWHKAITTLRTARPDLHHLREGGAEQEADLVLGLLNLAADFRDEGGGKSRGAVTMPNPNAPTALDFGVLKYRRGQVGHWRTAAFHGRTGVIRDPKFRGEID